MIAFTILNVRLICISLAIYVLTAKRGLTMLMRLEFEKNSRMLQNCAA